MNKHSNFIALPLLLIAFIFTIISCSNNQENSTSFRKLSIGSELDSLNGVKVYYNESFSNTSGRNVTSDGYNLGLKYQCVEFVKRYYFEHYNHKMPNAWGNAKDFFLKKLKDGQLNHDRGLIQCKNGSKFKPEVGNIVVFDGSMFNRYGHVAIISKVSENEIEVIQQNCGTSARVDYPLIHKNSGFTIKESRILGWLKMR